MKSLEERRIEAFKKFARTLASNDRYKDWFPLKENDRRLRQDRKYEEFFARTERLYQSPLYRMRRFLNDNNNEPVSY